VVLDLEILSDQHQLDAMGDGGIVLDQAPAKNAYDPSNINKETLTPLSARRSWLERAAAPATLKKGGRSDGALSRADPLAGAGNHRVFRARLAGLFVCPEKG
jgi:hypothetical protein